MSPHGRRRGTHPSIRAQEHSPPEARPRPFVLRDYGDEREMELFNTDDEVNLSPSRSVRERREQPQAVSVNVYPDGYEEWLMEIEEDAA